MGKIKIHNEEVNSITLSFLNKKLEKDFYAYYIDRYLWQLKLAHILAITFFFVAVFAENLLVDVETISIWLRIGVVVPSFTIGLVLTFVKPDFYKKNYQYFNIYYVFVTGISFILAGAFSSVEFMYSLYSGLIICLLFNYAFIRLSFVISSGVGTVLVVAYIYISFFAVEHANYLAHMTIYTIVVHFFGMFISYLIEYDSKRSYLLLMQTREDAQKIIAANKNLEGKVKERTAELTKAKQKAEEGDRLKTEFLNNMSHEIRTPMNGIIGFSQMLDEPEVDNEMRKAYVGIIQSSSQQLLRIIDDILEISTLETHQVNAVIEKFCLNDLLMELFTAFILRAKEHKIHLYLHKGLDEEESKIYTDKTRLRKVLSNLIENAFKFTHEGSIEFGYERNGGDIEFYVKDTGVGIEQSKFETIFKRFSQETSDLSRTEGGLGLGLSIAQANIKLLGGNIRLESLKGRGSTFYVRIPYVIYLSQKEEIRVNKLKIIAKNFIKVLIAEDDEINFLFVEEILQQSREVTFEVSHVKNGLEALNFCENNEVDLVIMDIKMPVMNGYEATTEIKKIKPGLPVIALTAFSTERDRDKALAYGCDDFISKPVDRDMFFAKIFQLVNVETN